MNCTVRISADKAEVWVPTQNSEASLAALSEASGLPLDKCEVYRHDLGGGFGRRGGTQDYVHQAVAIAKEFPGVPVKLIWSREEDMAHDFYRPISQCRLSAGLDADGKLVGLHVRVSGQSINAWLIPPAIKGGKDMRQLQGYYEEPGDAQFGYTVPNLLIEYAMRNTHVPVGPWRGVNTNQNGVYMECFMDEVARAAGKDPLEFRRALMSQHPKHLAVLNAAAEKGDWGKPLPAGVHRGIAQFMGYGSYSAAVAEVSVSDKGKLKVHRMVLALNCGHAVNPDQIAAQVEGSVAYGLTAALYGECTVENGRMVEQNFDTYQIMRLAEMPKVETVIVPTYDFWGGVGEPTICVVTPAVLNAIHAATGKPVRSLPLKNVKLVPRRLQDSTCAARPGLPCTTRKARRTSPCRVSASRDRRQKFRESPREIAARPGACGELELRGVRAAHDERELLERRVVEAVVLQESVEAAELAFVREVDVRYVVGNRVARLRGITHLLGRHVQELRVLVDEARDQPRAGNAVYFGALARDPARARSRRFAVGAAAGRLPLGQAAFEIGRLAPLLIQRFCDALADLVPVRANTTTLPADGSSRAQLETRSGSRRSAPPIVFVSFRKASRA